MTPWDGLQWAAMLVTVVASWWMASTQKRRRSLGFAVFLLSNVLWVVWGLHAQAYAIVAMQFCLVVLNVRGLRKNQ